MTTARPTYAALLRVRGVPPVFGVATASVLASSLQILALSISVYRDTGSALWSSSAFAAGFLPQLAGGTLLTSLADRWPTLPLLAGGALLRVAAGVVLAFGGLPPAAAIAVVAGVALVLPVPSAAQSALVARLLDGELYVLGRSVFTLISSGGQLLGLAVGGTVVTLLGTSAAFGVAAGIQLAGLLAVARVPAMRPPATAVPWRAGETWRGNATLLRERPVRRILLSWWIPLALLVGAESLVVAYVGERGGSGAATGILLAAFPAGSAVGDLVVGRLLGPGARRRALPWLLCTVGAALLPMALHLPIAVTAVCCALACGGLSYQLCGQQAFLAAVPEDRRGLAFGLASTGMMAGQGAGPVVAGAVADMVGAGRTMTVLGAVILVCALPLTRRQRADSTSPSPTVTSPTTVRSPARTSAIPPSTSTPPAA